ncbi:MAG: phosphoadenosine phosphosulfate reductase, partial [Candidatus Thiodiazotropha sp.]
MRTSERITSLQLEDANNLDQLNRKLECLTAEQRIEWALQALPGQHVLTSSFGIQGALMLHLVTRVAPDI